MAFWFIENAMDRTRQENAARRYKEQAAFDDELKWANHEKMLEELRRAGVAMGFSAPEADAIARTTAMNPDFGNWVKGTKAKGVGTPGFENLGRAGNDSAIAKEDASKAGSIFQRKFWESRNAPGAAGAMNTADEASTIGNQNMAAEGRGFAPFANFLGGLKGKRDVARAEADQAGSVFDRDFIRAKQPFAEEAGKTSMQATNEAARAAAFKAANDLAQSRAFADAGGPKLTANYQIPPQTYTNRDGTMSPFSQFTRDVQGIQATQSKEAQQDQEWQNQLEAIAMIRQRLNDPTKPLSEADRRQLEYALIQALIGRGLTSMPLPGNPFAMRYLQGGGGGGSAVPSGGGVDWSSGW